MSDQNLSVKRVRENCLECSGGSRSAVIWCPCHGGDGSRCEFWPFRFGVQPGTFRAKYGDRLLTPAMMPAASVELDSLPGTLDAAATGMIEVPGYREPAVTVERKQGRKMSPEKRKAAAERLQKAREAKVAGR